MRQIILNTTTALGSLSNWWRGDEVPRALKRPELIFTDSGGYQILLGAGLGSEDPAVDACYVDYVDEERRAGAILGNDARDAVMLNTFRQYACSARTLETAVTCPAKTLYQGDPLTLDLNSEQPASRIGIVDPDWNIFLLPVEKNSRPGMPPEVRILAGAETALPYSYDSAALSGERSVHVETKGGRVFTKSGWYIAVSVPGPRCDREHTTDLGACWIHYLDTPQPPVSHP